MMCFSSFIGTIVGPVKEELNGHYFFFILRLQDHCRHLGGREDV